MSTVETMLDNYRSFKNGDEPTTALDKIRAEVDLAYEENNLDRTGLRRDRVHVGTAYWDRLRGQCTYNMKFATNKRNFGARVSRSTHMRYAPRHYIILVNRAIVEAGDDVGNWKDTTRHELAHAVQREVYGFSVSSHGSEFRECARMIGAKPRACHSIRPDILK